MYEVGEIPMESREVVRDKQNPKITLERSLTLGDALLLLLGFQKLQPTLLAGLNPSLLANERGKKKKISPRVGWDLSPCRGRRRNRYSYSTEWTGRDGHEDTRKGGPCFLFIPRVCRNANRKREYQVVFVNKRKL